MKINIVVGKKKSYIIGSKVVLNNDDPTYDKCEDEDVLIKSWLIDPMTDKLMSCYVQCGILKEV